MNNLTFFKTTLLAFLALLLPYTAWAQSAENDAAPVVFEWFNKNMMLRLSGQINFLVFYAHDGSEDEVFVASNSTYNSRLNINTLFRLKNSLLTSGSNIQFGFPINPSETVNQIDKTFKKDINTRKLEWYVRHKYWGTVFLGQGSTASDFTSEMDYSNTDIVANSSVADIGAGLFLRDATGSIAGTPPLASLYDNLDGFGRAVRVQYTSPRFHGLQLSTSYAGEAKGDISLWYEQVLHRVKIGAAIALTSTHDYFSGANTLRGNSINGSASMLWPMGTSITMAGGYINAKTDNRSNPLFFYVKLGQQGRPFNLGTTAVSIDYGQFEHFYFNHTANVYGAQFLQNIAPLNGEVYVGYRYYHPNHEFKAIHVAFAGFRYYL